MKEAGKSKVQLALNYFMRHGKAFPGTESLLPEGLIKPEAKDKAAAAAAGSDQPYIPIDFSAIRRALKKPPKPGDRSALAARGNYFAEIERVRQERKCDFVKAATIVNKEKPELWRQAIQDSNPDRKFDGGE